MNIEQRRKGVKRNEIVNEQNQGESTPRQFDVAVAVVRGCRAGSHFGHEKNAAVQARFAETQARFGEMPSEICRDAHLAKSRQISANLGKSRLLVDFRPQQSENRLPPHCESGGL